MRVQEEDIIQGLSLRLKDIITGLALNLSQKAEVAKKHAFGWQENKSHTPILDMESKFLSIE